MGLRGIGGGTPAALRRPPPTPLRHRLTCRGCQRKFIAGRIDAKFCCDTCRMRGYRARRYASRAPTA